MEGTLDRTIRTRSSLPQGCSGAPAPPHDLRGALAAILAAVEVLESAGCDPDTADEARDIIARQAQRLARAVRQMA